MRLNTNKSKYGEISATSIIPESFKFIGSYLDPNEEINARIMAANKAYYRMRPIMNSQSGVSTKLKVRLYNSIVKPVLMFNLWTIPARKGQRDRINRTHRRQLRSVMGHHFKEDETMVTCQEIYTQTDSVPISVELTERRWTLLGHILRLDPETTANKAMVQYFRKTIGGIKRTSYAGAQRTSIMTMMRDEYRSYTNNKMKQIVGTSQFTHEMDLG